MPKVNFIFAIHFHQPVGQLKWINERIYENSYKLLLEVFKKYSSLHFTVHISGPLLFYMLDHHPEWISEMAKLGDYWTIEFLAGSLAESIIPLLPIEDRYLQIKEYISLFEKHFGYKPRGMWLPERVYEPSLPRPLSENGIEYVLVDDSTLYRAGHSHEDSYYAWLTEDGGHPLKVFFIEAGLRYVLPWKTSEEVLSYMVQRGDENGDRVLVWGSDAEKFGEWRDPGWAQWWLNDFLSKLLTNMDAIRMVHPSEYLKQYGVRGLLYLPTGSYDKMLEWSNGFFRNFLIKYIENNNMHKKILYVRSKLVKAGKVPYEAWISYLLGQCNDAFWHGLFGGIYLIHLRQAIYENLIRAERIAEEYMDYYSSRDRIVRIIDFDYDGKKEIIYETPHLNAYFKPSDGGTLFELDVKDEGIEHNLQDTMTRYHEPYIAGMGFNPDWYRRVSLRIHLWDPYTGLWDWINNTPFKDQSDLALKEHKVVLEPSGELVMRTIGAHYVYGLEPATVIVEKRVTIREKTLTTTYMLKNKGARPINAKIGFEYHISPKIDRENHKGELGYIVNNELHDIYREWSGAANEVTIQGSAYPPITLRSSGTDLLWIAPLNMPAQTEKGMKQVFQGLGIMFLNPIVLKGGDQVRVTIELKVTG